MSRNAAAAPREAGGGRPLSRASTASNLTEFIRNLFVLASLRVMATIYSAPACSPQLCILSQETIQAYPRHRTLPQFRSWNQSFCTGGNIYNSSYFLFGKSARHLAPLFCSQTDIDSSYRENVSKENEVNKKEESTQEVKSNSSLSALDSYFSKLQGSTIQKEAGPISTTTNFSSISSTGYQGETPRLVQGLNALNAYFDRMRTPVRDPAKRKVVEPSKDVIKDATDEHVLNFLKELEGTLDKNVQSSGEIQHQNKNDGVDLLKERQRNASYFANIFVGINVAIFLFGLASPVQTPEMVEVSLPFLYGAKINELIADGQWWRLITPMFLHDGLIHIGLGAWALLSFGPAVEYVYGSAGFCMIYFLGGVFGNLMSFFHTPAATVGGTGPLYALVAAWAVHVIQNRNFFAKELQVGMTNDVIQKVLVMSALHLALTDALPADNWTHVGATVAGILFGVLATPRVEMNVRLEDLDNNMALFGEAPDLQRQTLAFALCVGIYFCLYSFGSPAANELLSAISQNSSSNFL